MAGQVHRFRDAAGVHVGDGSTDYLSARQAEIMGRALLAVARSIRRESFVDSPPLTVEFDTLGGTEGIPHLKRGEDGRAKR